MLKFSVTGPPLVHSYSPSSCLQQPLHAPYVFADKGIAALARQNYQRVLLQLLHLHP